MEGRFANIWSNWVAYRLCPSCFRAVPLHAHERYCINDGSWLLEACPICEAPITSPYARFCGECGFGFEQSEVVLRGGIK